MCSKEQSGLEEIKPPELGAGEGGAYLHSGSCCSAI